MMLPEGRCWLFRTNLSDLGERVAVGGVAAVPELAHAVGADHGPAAPQRLVPVEHAATAPVIDGGKNELKICRNFDRKLI